MHQCNYGLQILGKRGSVIVFEIPPLCELRKNAAACILFILSGRPFKKAMLMLDLSLV